MKSNKQKTADQIVLEFIIKNPGTDIKAIENGTDYSNGQLKDLTKQLLTSGSIVIEKTGRTNTFKPVAVTKSTKPVTVTKPAAKKSEVPQLTNTAKKKIALAITSTTEPATLTNTANAKREIAKREIAKRMEAVEEARRTANNFNRNYSKVMFNGMPMSKGTAVLEVIKKYVQNNPRITPNQLKSIFPDTLLPVYGVFVDADLAKQMSPVKKRYFINDNQLIRIKGKTIAVSNQWTSESIKSFAKHAKALGYTIKCLQ